MGSKRLNRDLKHKKDSKSWGSAIIGELEKTIKTTEEFRGITLAEFKEVFLKR